jgi:hypothetical protein
MAVHFRAIRRLHEQADVAVRNIRIRSRDGHVSIKQAMQEMNRPFVCTLLWILLFMNSRHSDWRIHTNASSSSKSLASPARGPIERWCAAYSRLDEKELAALESPNIETVDRFGELHVAQQRNDEEHSWSEGLEMIRREDFHPVCDIEEIRATHPDVVIVHTDITYPGGILLKGGDFIPAFSEIHTFVVSRHDAVWRIAEHDITRRALQ